MMSTMGKMAGSKVARSGITRSAVRGLASAALLMAIAACGGGGYGGSSMGATPQGGPMITAAPKSQSVTQGQTATFTVTATGYGMLSYRWLRNSAAVAGATQASYTTPTTTLADSGTQFAVQVTDGYGVMVTSSPAMLTVM